MNLQSFFIRLTTLLFIDTSGCEMEFGDYYSTAFFFLANLDSFRKI